MRYAFSAEGTNALTSLAFTRALYAFDFDGVLAPIIPDSQKATMPPLTSRLLAELARIADVAVISGRSRHDLRKRVTLPGKSLIGNHGIEVPGVHNGSIQNARKICRQWMKQLRNESALQRREGIFIESKEFSLALHYRKSRHRRKARLELLDRIATLSPSPRIIMGKCVINLVPPKSPHKGIGLLQLMKKSSIRYAMFVGDDDTDEDVFSLADARIVSIRVGSNKTSRAQYYLRRRNEINRLLRLLISKKKEVSR